MKKILTFLIALTFSVALFGQVTINAGGTWATARGIINSNFLLMAPKASPTFTGTVTLPTWKIGAVTISTNGTELNILSGALVNTTELNYLVGVTSAIQTQLNGKAATSHNQAQTTITALPDSLLIRYTKAQADAKFGGGGYTNLTSFIAQTNWRVFYSNGSGDVTELALGADGTYLKSNGASAAPTFATPAGSGDVLKSDSTVVFTTPTQVDVKINSRLQEKEDSGSVGINYTDTAFFYTYISGSGEPGDSVLFAKGKKHFGVFKVKIDTCVAVSVDIIGMSAGDSCRFNLYYGNYMTGVATDSLFSSVQGAGTTRRTLTTTAKKIPPSADVWLGLKANQITGKRPKELALQFNFSKIATTY